MNEEQARIRSYLVAQGAKLTPAALVDKVRSAMADLRAAAVAVPAARFGERPEPEEWSGNEVMAHVGALLDLPVAANCVAAAPADGGAEVTRVRWGGSLLEVARLHTATTLLTVQPHAVPFESTADGEPALEGFTPSVSDAAGQVRVVDRVGASTGGISLTDAKVVVSGGRGAGSTEGFGVVEELAGLLGGAVGCSRAVTMAGWRPHTDQVGQTGTKIAPDLYIACGISGATQHMAGCKGAKRILAINSDREAPILASADYAVIGDMHEILPALSAAIRAARSS